MKSKINFRKILSCLLIAGLVFGILGCRTKTDTTKKDYSGVELTYYKPFDDSEVIEPLIGEYVAKNPGLKINYKKFDDFDEYQKVVLSEMAEGKGPDIFSMPNWWYASNLGKISVYPQSENNDVGVFHDLFVDVANNDLVKVDEDGQRQIYALPMTVDTLALYYNKDQYADKLPEKGRPAKTWEGIKEDVTFLNKMHPGSKTDFDVSGIAMGGWDNISRAADIVYLLFLQYGAPFYNDNMSQATFASRHEGALTYPGAEALNLYLGFADPKQKHFSWSESSADPNSVGKEIDAFATGRVSMIVGYAYTYNDIVNRINVLKTSGEKTISKDAIMIAPIPQVYDPDVSSEKRVTYASYFAETVSRNCKNPDVAWDFLVFLTSKKALGEYFQSTHKPTSRRDMINDQAKDPIYGVFAQQIGYAESFPIVDYYKYKQIFVDTLRSAYQNGMGSRTNLLDAQNAITKMLPINGYINKEKTLTPEEQKAKDDAAAKAKADKQP